MRYIKEEDTKIPSGIIKRMVESHHPAKRETMKEVLSKAGLGDRSKGETAPDAMARNRGGQPVWPQDVVGRRITTGTKIEYQAPDGSVRRAEVMEVRRYSKGGWFRLHVTAYMRGGRPVTPYKTVIGRWDLVWVLRPEPVENL